MMTAETRGGEFWVVEFRQLGRDWKSEEAGRLEIDTLLQCLLEQL